MSERSIKIPGPEHPITIEKNPRRVLVMFEGQVMADSNNALTLTEAKYPAVQYIPRGDVDLGRLLRSEHKTYCPFKGDCAYFSLPGGGKLAANAVWTYEAPFAAVEAIRDHLAFYPDRVEISEIA